jgi:RNase P protein component
MESLLNARRWAEVERYAKLLEEYTRSEPLPICDFIIIARARALAAHGTGKPDSALTQELQHLCEEAERMSFGADLSALRAAHDST